MARNVMGAMLFESIKQITMMVLCVDPLPEKGISPTKIVLFTYHNVEVSIESSYQSSELPDLVNIRSIKIGNLDQQVQNEVAHSQPRRGNL